MNNLRRGHIYGYSLASRTYTHVEYVGTNPDMTQTTQGLESLGLR